MPYYFSLITIACILALISSANDNKKELNQVLLRAFCFLLFLFIGTRDGVGSDWGSYLIHYESTKGINLFEGLSWGDPLYVLLEWIGANIFGGIYLVNIVCSSIFMYGTYKMAESCENAWGFMLYMIPYAVFVVGMAYTRQSVAIGFEMLAILALAKGRMIRFLLFIMLGTLFHKTAIILILLAATKSTLKKIAITSLILFLLILTFSELFIEHSELIRNYTTKEYYSYGMFPRLLMYIIFLVIFMVKYGKNYIIGTEKYIIRNFYILLTPLIISAVFFSSTIADRILLYSLPISAVIFSNMFKLFNSKEKINFIYFQYLFNLANLAFWFKISPYSVKWVEYKSIII